jgi:nonsense-mediated mRNA decay protein 3
MNESGKKDDVKSVKIKKCPHCHSILLGQWSDGAMKERDIVTTIIESVFGVREPSFDVSGDEYNRKVSFKGISIKNGEKREGQFFIHTSLSTCPVCTRKLGNYYEAILQLRGERGERLEHILKTLLEAIEEAPSKDVFLTKMERIKEGYDLFLSDKQYARAIARKIIERFGGTFKETSHLVGMKKGTELYRITVSIRIPNFQKSDVIRTGNDLYLVVSIKSDLATLINIRTKSREKKKLQDLDDHLVYKTGESVKETDVLYRQGDTAYILDPFDFKEKAVIDPGDKDKIRVLKVDDEIFVVPQL